MITGIKKKNKLTEIWFDEIGSAVNIRTYNTDLKNRLTAYAAKYPAHCRLTDDDECGCLTFEIDRRRFSVRLTAPYSEDRGAVHRNNEHRIVAPTIQIRSLAACGPLRACRPETLLRKQNLPKEMTK